MHENIKIVSQKVIIVICQCYHKCYTNVTTQGIELFIFA